MKTEETMISRTSQWTTTTNTTYQNPKTSRIMSFKRDLKLQLQYHHLKLQLQYLQQPAARIKHTIHIHRHIINSINHIMATNTKWPAAAASGRRQHINIKDPYQFNLHHIMQRICQHHKPDLLPDLLPATTEGL